MFHRGSFITFDDKLLFLFIFLLIVTLLFMITFSFAFFASVSHTNFIIFQRMLMTGYTFRAMQKLL